MNLTDANFSKPVFGGGRNNDTSKFYGSTKAGVTDNLFCESIIEQA